MTDRPRAAWLNGRAVPFGEACIPLEDRGLQFGESLYEVVAVTRGRARLLPEHAERMRRGAAWLGLERGVPAAEGWPRLFEELQRSEQLEEGLLYAQVTGGSAPRHGAPPAEVSPTFFAYLEAFRFPREAQAQRGIRAISLPDIRWARRDLKTTMLLPGVLARRRAREQGAEEALFVGPDRTVHEGSSSNVFIVEGGTIFTPEQSEQLLPGITRPLVCRLAAEAGLPVADATLPLERLTSAGEVFITSTTRLVMPVVSVDGSPIGTGRAGPVSVDLARRLRRHLELD